MPMTDPYEAIKKHFSDIDDVDVNSGKGAQGMKVGKKMFVMFYKGDLIVQLPPDRVTQLIESGEAEPFDPGTGKPMKDRVFVPFSKSETWIRLSEESQAYAQSKS